jgi:glycosyltransferase involved in cell wall biosynthesis
MTSASQRGRECGVAGPGPVRVLVMRPTLGQGGADRVTAILLRHFDRKRFDLTLALLRRDGEFISALPADVPVRELGSRSTWTAWLPAARVIRSLRPDVVLSTSSGMNIVAALASLLSGHHSRLVLSERNTVSHGERTLKRKFVVALKRRLYRGADMVTAVSAGVRADLIGVLGLRRDRTAVVYNPVVEQALETDSEVTLSEPWLEPGGAFVLSAGRLVAQKDHATLLRAFRLVRDRTKAHLVILGDGPLRGSLQQISAELGLTEDVHLPGFDKNPFRYMARCSAFVLSSRHEGLANVLIQAMACGAPVVSTDCPFGPSEIITRDGHDGFLVPVGDAGAIANRLMRLLGDPELRQRMGAAARESAQRFRADVIVKRYEAAILGELVPDGPLAG